MLNPANLFKLKNSWSKFTQNHPRLPGFFQAASQGMIEEGSIIDVTITNAEGKKISTNVKLSQSDLELFKNLEK